MLIFGIDIGQLRLDVLLVAPVTIVAIGVLQRALLALYQYLLIILVLIELLLVGCVVAP